MIYLVVCSSLVWDDTKFSTIPHIFHSSSYTTLIWIVNEMDRHTFLVCNYLLKLLDNFTKE